MSDAGARGRSVGDRVRSVINKASLLADRSSIKEETATVHDGGPGRQPVTAAQAVERCFPLFTSVSGNVRLRSIASQTPVNLAGTATSWWVYAVLPDVAATASATWSLGWDEVNDSWSDPTIELSVRPFIPPGSMLGQMVTSGKVSRKKVLQRPGASPSLEEPDLPMHFADSDQVMAQARAAGSDPDFEELTLQSQSVQGQAPRWQLIRRAGPSLEFPFS